MPLLNSPDAYGTLAKILHWVLVLLLLLMMLGGFALTRIELPGFSQSGHEIIGKVVLALALVRLGLRLISPTPLPNPNHARWEVWLAHVIHWGLYIVLFLYPLSGWVMVSAGEFAETGALPQWLAPFGLANPAFDLHFAMKWALAGLVGLHVAGALKHAILDRDGTLRRMWFGRQIQPPGKG